MRRLKLFFSASIIGIIIYGAAFAGEGHDMLLKRQRMVEEQIAARGVTDPRVLAAMMKVERHLFVPAALQPVAYADEPLPVGHGQTISQPYIVAYMTEALRLGPGDRVLELGTGSGYQAAILAELVKEVYTIDLVKPLADTARERLASLGYKNIEVMCGDGYKGWPEKAPFDAIIVTAAPPEIPRELTGQLKTGGRMIVPVGSFFQELRLITRTEKGFDGRPLLPVRFVPMVRPDKR
jgi:protein-L-isoaspartate(D-aspartate) O-methyltransferase